MISKLKEKIVSLMEKKSQDLDFAFRGIPFLLELRKEVCFRISQSLLVIDPSKSSKLVLTV